MPQEKDKLDEALESALAQGGADDEAPAEVPEPESLASETEEPSATTPKEPLEEPPAETPSPAGKPKDAAPAPAGKKGQSPPAQQAAPTEQAPRTWSPVVREHWKALPRPVRDQILKREGEISRSLQESAEARKGYERVQKAIQPYLPHLQATGVEPVAAMENLFRVDYTLRSGTPAQKAAIAAQMIQVYGVDVETLAAALEGKEPPAAQQPTPFRDPRFDQFLGTLQQQQQQRAEQQQAKARAELDAFLASGQAEFFDEVLPEMQAVDKTYRAKGQVLSLQQVYEKACILNDDVRSVLEQRKGSDVEKRNASEAARTLSQRAQQARHAAGSVKSEPTSPTGGRKPSMDETLWAQLNGR